MAEGEQSVVDGGCSIPGPSVPGTEGLREEAMGTACWMVDSTQMAEALDASSRVYVEESKETLKVLSRRTMS